MQTNLQTDSQHSATPMEPPGKAYVPMTYFRFSSEDKPVFEGLVTNCSEDGLSFRAQRPLKPGQTVFIRLDPDRMVSVSGRQLPGCLRSMCLAEVYRCRRNADAIGGYAVSAKYLQPCY